MPHSCGHELEIESVRCGDRRFLSGESRCDALKFPSSRGSLRVRFSLFDVLWAALAPFLALYFRDAYILSPKMPSVRRISALGILLRKTHIDELPQLFNVLVGDMSLIGPRPLLPDDQPVNSSDRLLVRPGITGWAQVNGGKLVTPEEKGALDEWYIRHISPWLDLRIAMLTLRSLFIAERRSEEAISEAQSVRHTSYSMRPSSHRSEVRAASALDTNERAAVQRINNRRKVDSGRS